MGQVVMGYVAGNLPPGVTQGDIDRVFGRPLSDMAEEENDRQTRIQAAMQVLAAVLDAEEDTGVLAIGIDYGALRTAIESATVSPRKLNDLITDADAKRTRDAKAEAAEYRSKMRREYEA